MDQLRRELLDRPKPARCTYAAWPALAVHLLRHYRDPHGGVRRSNARPPTSCARSSG